MEMEGRPEEERWTRGWIASRALEWQMETTRLRLRHPISPTFPRSCSSFSYTSNPCSFRPTLTTSGAGHTGADSSPTRAEKPEESALCWHLINKDQTIVPVGFTHPPFAWSSAFERSILSRLSIYRPNWRGSERLEKFTWIIGAAEFDSLTRSKGFSCHQKCFISTYRQNRGLFDALRYK